MIPVPVISIGNVIVLELAPPALKIMLFTCVNGPKRKPCGYLTRPPGSIG